MSANTGKEGEEAAEAERVGYLQTQLANYFCSFVCSQVTFKPYEQSFDPLFVRTVYVNSLGEHVSIGFPRLSDANGHQFTWFWQLRNRTFWMTHRRTDYPAVLRRVDSDAIKNIAVDFDVIDDVLCISRIYFTVKETNDGGSVRCYKWTVSDGKCTKSNRIRDTDAIVVQQYPGVDIDRENAEIDWVYRRSRSSKFKVQPSDSADLVAVGDFVFVFEKSDGRREVSYCHIFTENNEPCTPFNLLFDYNTQLTEASAFNAHMLCVTSLQPAVHFFATVEGQHLLFFDKRGRFEVFFPFAFQAAFIDNSSESPILDPRDRLAFGYDSSLPSKDRSVKPTDDISKFTQSLIGKNGYVRDSLLHSPSRKARQVVMAATELVGKITLGFKTVEYRQYGRVAANDDLSTCIANLLDETASSKLQGLKRSDGHVIHLAHVPPDELQKLLRSITEKLPQIARNDRLAPHLAVGVSSTSVPYISIGSTEWVIRPPFSWFTASIATTATQCCDRYLDRIGLHQRSTTSRVNRMDQKTINILHIDARSGANVSRLIKNIPPRCWASIVPHIIDAIKLKHPGSTALDGKFMPVVNVSVTGDQVPGPVEMDSCIINFTNKSVDEKSFTVTVGDDDLTGFDQNNIEAGTKFTYYPFIDPAWFVSLILDPAKARERRLIRVGFTSANVKNVWSLFNPSSSSGRETLTPTDKVIQKAVADFMKDKGKDLKTEGEMNLLSALSHTCRIHKNALHVRCVRIEDLLVSNAPSGYTFKLKHVLLGLVALVRLMRTETRQYGAHGFNEWVKQWLQLVVEHDDQKIPMYMIQHLGSAHTLIQKFESNAKIHASELLSRVSVLAPYTGSLKFLVNDGVDDKMLNELESATSNSAKEEVTSEAVGSALEHFNTIFPTNADQLSTTVDTNAGYLNTVLAKAVTADALVHATDWLDPTTFTNREIGPTSFWTIPAAGTDTLAVKAFAISQYTGLFLSKHIGKPLPTDLPGIAVSELGHIDYDKQSYCASGLNTLPILCHPSAAHRGVIAYNQEECGSIDPVALPYSSSVDTSDEKQTAANYEALAFGVFNAVYRATEVYHHMGRAAILRPYGIISVWACDSHINKKPGMAAITPAVYDVLAVIARLLHANASQNIPETVVPAQYENETCDMSWDIYSYALCKKFSDDDARRQHFQDLKKACISLFNWSLDKLDASSSLISQFDSIDRPPFETAIELAQLMLNVV